jgi:hypothetical protein
MTNWKNSGTSYENSSNREAPNKHEKGSRKYREQIHRDSRSADLWKNLPFTFSKPTKKTRPKRDIYFQCEHCSQVKAINKYTCGVSCACGKYSSVTEGNTFKADQEPKSPRNVEISVTVSSDEVGEL